MLPKTQIYRYFALATFIFGIIAKNTAFLFLDKTQNAAQELICKVKNGQINIDLFGVFSNLLILVFLFKWCPAFGRIGTGKLELTLRSPLTRIYSRQRSE